MFWLNKWYRCLCSSPVTLEKINSLFETFFFGKQRFSLNQCINFKYLLSLRKKKKEREFFFLSLCWCCLFQTFNDYIHQEEVDADTPYSSVYAFGKTNGYVSAFSQEYAVFIFFKICESSKVSLLLFIISFSPNPKVINLVFLITRCCPSFIFFLHKTIRSISIKKGRHVRMRGKILIEKK